MKETNPLETVSKYARIIEILNKTKWWIVILLFISFWAYIFKAEVSHVIDYKLLDKDVIIERLENDVLIEESLYELMDKTESDRAYIFRFHNGVNYYNGKHKSKMSCDFEVTRAGVSQEAERLQDLPVGLYASWIHDVINYKMFFYDTSLIEDIRVKLELRRQGVRGIAVVPYYRAGKILALIGVDYINDIDPERLDDYLRNKQREIASFKVAANQIGRLLR